MISTEDLDNRFKFHPADEDTATRHEHIRDMCRGLADHVNRNVPDGREKALAMTALEEVMMWSNAGIAREL